MLKFNRVRCKWSLSLPVCLSVISSICTPVPLSHSECVGLPGVFCLSECVGLAGVLCLSECVCLACVCVCVFSPSLQSHSSLQQRLWSSPLRRCHVPKTLRQQYWHTKSKLYSRERMESFLFFWGGGERLYTKTATEWTLSLLQV